MLQSAVNKKQRESLVIGTKRAVSYERAKSVLNNQKYQLMIKKIKYSPRFQCVLKQIL